MLFLDNFLIFAKVKVYRMRELGKEYRGGVKNPLNVDGMHLISPTKVKVKQKN